MVPDEEEELVEEAPSGAALLHQKVIEIDFKSSSPETPRSPTPHKLIRRLSLKRIPWASADDIDYQLQLANDNREALLRAKQHKAAADGLRAKELSEAMKLKRT